MQDGQVNFQMLAAIQSYSLALIDTADSKKAATLLGH